MMKVLRMVTMVLVSAVCLVFCGKEKTTDNARPGVQNAQGGLSFKIETQRSRIEWRGYKLVKSENMSHFGTVNFKDGTLSVKDGKLVGGSFTADMGSLQSADLQNDPAQKSKLEAHLKGGEFFNAAKFPVAKFEISKIAAQNSGDYNTILDGNLTIKGITKSVRFPANVTVTGNEVKIATEPTDINREDFGIKFNLPTENGIIKNEITLQIFIVASN